MFYQKETELPRGYSNPNENHSTMFFCHEEGNAKNREEISPSTRELTLPLCPNHPKNQNPFSSFKPMNKETELAYLNTILGSANDILTVLKHMESQFQSMEERSAGTMNK